MRAALVALAVVSACRAAPSAEPSAEGNMPPAPTSHDAEADDGRLPDRAGSFEAGPVLRGEGFVRRIYARGPVQVNVTLGAQGGGGRAAFERWVSMSASYPQVSLRAAAGEVNGFFDCKAPGGDERCDAHVHFRNGAHLELFSSGTATRGDLQGLLDALPIEPLAAKEVP